MTASQRRLARIWSITGMAGGVAHNFKMDALNIEWKNNTRYLCMYMRSDLEKEAMRSHRNSGALAFPRADVDLAGRAFKKQLQSFFG